MLMWNAVECRGRRGTSGNWQWGVEGGPQGRFTAQQQHNLFKRRIFLHCDFVGKDFLFYRSWLEIPCQLAENLATFWISKA